LIQLAAAVLQILAAVGAIASIVGFITSNWALLAAGGTATIASLATTYIAYKAIISSTTLRNDIYWRSATFTYTISKNAVDYDQVVEIEIQALRDGINTFVNKYWWTGTGEQDIRVLSKGHFLEGPPIPREAWRYYRVNLGRALPAGSTERVVIKQVLKDQGKTHEPILSKTVTEPIGKLALKVNLPRNRHPAKITRNEYSSAFIINPVSSEIADFDTATWQIRWEISNPKLGHTYTIRWEY
jgi:hypothetical protein